METLDLSNKELYRIVGLDDFTKLKELHLNDNKITEIEGLDKLVCLEYLILHGNKITEIKSLDKLEKLKYLDLCYNQITEIKGLDNLNLYLLNLSNNQITEIKGLDNLVDLEYLYLHDNEITELPLSLCNLKNMKEFKYDLRQVDDIPLPVERWLNRIPHTKNYNVDEYIQPSFYNSLSTIFKDIVYSFDITKIKNDINNNDILTELTKNQLLSYCDDNTEHTTYLITYADLMFYVWPRISKNERKDEIYQALNQELSNKTYTRVSSRLIQLLNILATFYDDIEFTII